MNTIPDMLARLFAVLAGPLGIIVTVVLIALLLAREVTNGLSGARARRVRGGLGIAATPLLASFAVIVALRVVVAPAGGTATPAAIPGAVARWAAEPGQATATPAPAPVPTVVAAPAVPPTPAAANATATAAPSPAVVLRRFLDAQDNLRSGQFEMTLDYGGGIRSISTVSFDLGDGNTAPRLAVRTVYQGATGSRTGDRIAIGGRSWTREADGAWVEQGGTTDVRATVAAYLPPDVPLTAEVVTDSGPLAVLRWSENARNTAYSLQVDPASGVPRQLYESVRTGGATTTVRYIQWNGAVDIAPPAP